MAEPDTADLNPDFLKAITSLRDYANAQGIPTHVISAFRTAEDQRQLYANFLAGKAGQPLPYPDRGAVPLAAAPGTSLHEKGLAADIATDDPARQAELRDYAGQFGLNTLGAGDPTHFQMAKASSTSPVSGTANAVSTSQRDNPLLAALIHYESGGQNITNTRQSTSSGRARGFLQITDGTWNEFGGGKFGATAQDVPFATQLAVGSNIPLSRWAPETLDYLRQQGIKFDPGKTLGENIAMNGGGGWSGQGGGVGTELARAMPMGPNLNSAQGWMQMFGRALAQGPGAGVGGGMGPIVDPPDQPPIRTPAQTTQIAASAPSPMPVSSNPNGMGATLASLTDTGLAPPDTSLNMGAPSMSSFTPENAGNPSPITGVGAINPLSMFPSMRYSRLS